MTHHRHAAKGPEPGSGPGPSPGTGPRDAVPGAGAGVGEREQARAPGQPGAPHTDERPGSADGTGGESVAGTTGAAEHRNPASGPETGTAGAGTAAGARPGTDTAAGGRPGGDTAAGAHLGAGTPAGAQLGAETGSDGTDGVPKFRRHRAHRMIGGVCAGLGRQCDMDPVIFRITLAVLAATGGIGLIFYGFAWLFVPYDDEDENEVRKLLTGRVDGPALAAVLFALVGCGVFLSMLGNGSVLTFGIVLSLLLAGAGYWSQHRGAHSPDPLAAQAAADAPPEAQAPPVPAIHASWWRDPIVKDGTHVGGTGYLWGPRDAGDRYGRDGRDVAAAVNIGFGAHSGTPRDAYTRPVRTGPPRPHGIGGWVFLLALAAGALGSRLTWDAHALGTSLQAGLACALAVFGLGIAVSAFLGRTGIGSILLALITAALLAASTALPKDITTQWGQRTWQPAATADVRPEYRLGTGEGTLDLTRIHLGKGATVTTKAQVGAGRLRVIVPAGVTVRANIEVGLGDIQLPGDSSQDVDVAPGRHQQVTLPATVGGKNAGTVDLKLHVGMGQAEVSRAAP
ncbi:PspC domain-containing protein [Streptomyces sp. NPDC014889]|uniref:PspC domain-containing protein n=1 Tax=Streptomyces sp. NPDC014889 TaxID=3364928 RepID=UPI0036FFF3FE